jgi:hypothetical protein
VLNARVKARLAVARQRVVVGRRRGRIASAEAVRFETEVRVLAVAHRRHLEVQQRALGQVVGAADRIDRCVAKPVVRVHVIDRGDGCSRWRGLPGDAAPFVIERSGSRYTAREARRADRLVGALDLERSEEDVDCTRVFARERERVQLRLRTSEADDQLD